MPAPRLGFVQQTMWPWEETLRWAAGSGFDHVELLMDGDHDRTALDPIADEIRTTADDLGVDLLVHLPFRLDVGSPFEHVREGSVRELAAAIETAGAFGAEKGVVHAHSHAWPPVWDRETVQGHLFDSVRRLDRHGREHGVEVCVENLKGDWLTLEEFPALLDATDASVALDTGHARMEGHADAEIAAFAREHADRISHVHVNETLAQLEHIPVGAGDLDFVAVLDALFEGADGANGRDGDPGDGGDDPDGGGDDPDFGGDDPNGSGVDADDDAGSDADDAAHRGGWAGTLSIEVFTPNVEYVRASGDHLRAVLADIDG